MHGAETWLVAALGGQPIGFPVWMVTEVVEMQNLTPVPGAPKGVAGLTPVRGRVLPVVDLVACLSLPENTKIDNKNKPMNVIVSHDGTLYSFGVDAVRDTQVFAKGALSPLPQTMASLWHRYSTGIYHLPEHLVVALDIPALLDDLKGKEYGSR